MQLEIESATEALAQRQAPGAIQVAAERRMNHDVRAAVFVKESLGDDLLLRGHHAERQLCCDQVLDDLFGGAALKTDFICEPLQTGSACALARVVC